MECPYLSSLTEMRQEFGTAGKGTRRTSSASKPGRLTTTRARLLPEPARTSWLRQRLTLTCPRPYPRRLASLVPNHIARGDRSVSIRGHRLLAPIAIGAAAGTRAGTGAAFAAGNGNSDPRTGARRVRHSERSVDRSSTETTIDVRTDSTNDAPSTGVTTAPRGDTSKDQVGMAHRADTASNDAATGVDG
jgi:hypothetical protein